MRHFNINIPERPAFMKLVEPNQQENTNGYTLRLNPENPPASIIIFNKRRGVSMIKTVIKALEGFETIFDELNYKKESLEADKQTAIQEAIAQVEAKFAENAERIDKAIETISVTEEIEVPDEEVVEETTDENAGSVDGTVAY